MIHSFKDHIFGIKMTPTAWFYLPFDKVVNVNVFTLWKLLLQENHVERLSIHLDGMK